MRFIYILIVLIGPLSLAQTIDFPDPKFKNALVNHNQFVIDTNGDGEIQVSEAEAVKGIIDVGIKDIDDLTGIEFFINSEGVDFSYNNLTSVDLSQNSSMWGIGASGNPLTELILPNNCNLENISISQTTLTSLDLSGCPLLDRLNVGYNETLAEINVQGTQLRDLTSIDGALVTLDLSGLEQLEEVRISRNPLTSINLEGCTNLYDLSLAWNDLSEIDLSDCISLVDVNLLRNSLTELDVTNSPDLVILRAQENEIASLDLSQNQVLETLVVNENNLTELDLSQNPSMYGLDFSDNNIAAYDATLNPDLAVLRAANNNLSEIDLANNPDLFILNLSGNALSEVDITQNPDLEDVRLSDNQISDFNFLSENLFEYFAVDGNQLTTLDLGSNVIREFYCQNNDLTELNLDFTGSPRDHRIDVSGNRMIDLDLSKTEVRYLQAGDNPELVTLNLRNGANWRFEFDESNLENLPALISVCLDESGNNSIMIPWIEGQVGRTLQFYNNETCDDFTLSLEDHSGLAEIRIAPNPVSDHLTITSTQPIARYRLFDITGGLLNVERYTGDDLDLSTLPSGMYFLELTTDQGRSSVHKLIKK